MVALTYPETTFELTFYKDNLLQMILSPVAWCHDDKWVGGVGSV
jgi:hypothetical protein